MFPIVSLYFSCLDTRKVTEVSVAKEIPNRIGEPTRFAQTAEFQKMLTPVLSKILNYKSL